MDVSWSILNRQGFVGVVIRGQRAEFVVAVRSQIHAPFALVAEALAILHGCQLAADLGYQSIIIEDDSQALISYLASSLEAGSWEVFPILSIAK